MVTGRVARPALGGRPDEEEFMPEHKGRRWISGRAIAIGGCATLLGGFALAGQASTGLAATAATARVAVHATTDSTCHLGNGVKHVVQLTFDNVHFFRDNPNVPSDLEMMPNLLNFFESNGTFSRTTTRRSSRTRPIDILTTLTGLYGDRQGMPGINNAYQTFNPDGTTDPAGSFAYWTDPIFDTAVDAEPGARHEPVDGLLADAAGHHVARPRSPTRSHRPRGCPTPARAATPGTSGRRTWSWRTPR